jgi:hypothetical protein
LYLFVLTDKSYFDAEGKLDAQLFELMCCMGQLELRIQENAAAQVTKSKLILPPQPLNVVNNNNNNSSSNNNQSKRVKARLAVLENEYLTAMCRYNDSKALVGCWDSQSHAALRLQLRRIAREAAGSSCSASSSASSGGVIGSLSSPIIDTEEELEWLFQLDAERRQGESDLSAAQADRRRLSRDSRRRHATASDTTPLPPVNEAGNTHQRTGGPERAG